MGAVILLFVMDPTPSTPRPLTPWEEISVLHDELASAARARREADLRCARALARLEQLDGLLSHGCASVGELGERHGVSAVETRALLDLGRALPAQPLLEQQVADGKITVAAGAIVAQALTRPELQEGEDDWIEWARTRPTRALARELRRREEKARNGGRPVVPIWTFVSLQARDDFARCRVIASRKASRTLSSGETLGVVFDHYLDTFDEERVTPGERRCPPTALVNGRYVPRAVRREVYERQGQQCAVPLCEHTMFLEKAHLVPHASGGDREADNLVLLCSLHHFFFDQGYIRLVGTAAKPRFFDDEGRDLGCRYDVGCATREGASVRLPDPARTELPSAAVEAAGSRGGAGPPRPPERPPDVSLLGRSDPPVPWDGYFPSEYLDDDACPECAAQGRPGVPRSDESTRSESDSRARPGATDPSWVESPFRAEGEDGAT